MTSSDTHNPLDDGLQDLGLPVPVQTFLWRQIAPFIRPRWLSARPLLKFNQNLRNRFPLLRLGKLHEASCMVRTFSSLIYSISANNHHYHQLRLRWISLIQLCKTRLWEIKALAVHETHLTLSIQFDSAKKRKKQFRHNLIASLLVCFFRADSHNQAQLKVH